MKAWLLMKTVGGDDRPFPIRKERTVLGRDAHCDVRIPIPAVALRHCEVILGADSLRLVDLGSVTGTRLNGEAVHEAVLADADEVTVGPVTFQVRIAEDGKIARETIVEVKQSPSAPLDIST